jgi:hypothetical protein
VNRFETREVTVLRHVVMFQWKAGTSAEAIREIEEAMCGLQATIPEITEFECGTDVSVQGLSQGFTHCFVVSYASEQDRDTYQVHPDHQAFLALSAPHREKVLTFDYFVRGASGDGV